MTDDIINKLITIRAMGVAKVNVHKDSVMSIHNGKTFDVDDILILDKTAKVSLIIEGTITDFTPEEVMPLSGVNFSFCKNSSGVRSPSEL